MTILTKQEFGFKSLEQAKNTRNELIWREIEGISLESVLSSWLDTLSERTRMNYRSGLNKLIEYNLINPFISLQAFALINFDTVVDKIKQLPVAETTRQARAALFISFTRYLSRKFKGVFNKAIPCRDGNEKTFYRVHEKVVTKAMTQKQWSVFFVELEKINPRDALLGKITLQGGKRVGEVLNLLTEQINWDNNEITFRQSKTRGVIKETVITYPDEIMCQIKELVGDRQGYVFLSRKGNPVHINQVTNTFTKAGKKAKIPFTVTPHVLRASCVTALKQAGYSDGEIAKVTGHASGEMVRAYDKTDRADNPSKKISLI